jgi:hypothetical protein
MRTTVSALIASAALAVLSGCQGVPGEIPISRVVAIEIPLANDECGVVSASALIEADDIPPLGPIALEVADGEISGLIESVPEGLNRDVEVSAFNEADEIVYEGSEVVNVIADRTNLLNITLLRNTDNCPLDGGAGGALTGSIRDEGRAWSR